MSGLIWAGIGKGIADAGATIGSAMMRDVDAREAEDRAEKRAIAADDRALLKARELQKLKDESDEAKAKRDADITVQAEQSAPAIGDKRRFDQFKKDVGETAMSDDELRKVFNDQYNQQKVGSFEGADRYREKYSREKEDTLNEIRRLGGSSTAIKEARDSYRATVDAETRSEKEALDRRREDRRDNEARDRADRDSRRLDILDKNAETNRIRAERPPATARSGLSGMTEVKLNQEAETLRKAAKDASSMDARRDYEARLKEVMDEIQARRKGTSSTPRSGDNGSVKKGGESSASSSAKPAVDSKTPPKIEQVQGAPSGSTIGSFVTGKGWEVRDKSGRVVGHIR